MIKYIKKREGDENMQIQKRAAQRYLLIQIGLVCAVCLFPLYRSAAEQLSRVITNCVLHDRLFLYCPLCGGTRAIAALLDLDIALAFEYNPFVILGILVAIVLDTVALFRLLRGHHRLMPLPQWFWITVLIFMIGYGILRNWLMIGFGYDPIGDLGAFWNK